MNARRGVRPRTRAQSSASANAVIRAKAQRQMQEESLFRLFCLHLHFAPFESVSRSHGNCSRHFLFGRNFIWLFV